MEKQRFRLSKGVDVMGFYADPITPGCDIIHAEFMDRNRMEMLMNKMDSRHNETIRKHLDIHDYESTKRRLAALGEFWKD